MRIPLPATTPPLKFSVRIVLSKPAVLSVPPLTLTVAPTASEVVLPSTRLPALIPTLNAASDPFRFVTPVFTVAVPRPRFASTVPPCNR